MAATEATFRLWQTEQEAASCFVGLVKAATRPDNLPKSDGPGVHQLLVGDEDTDQERLSAAALADVLTVFGVKLIYVSTHMLSSCSAAQ